MLPMRTTQLLSYLKLHLRVLYAADALDYRTCHWPGSAGGDIQGTNVETCALAPHGGLSAP